MKLPGATHPVFLCGNRDQAERTLDWVRRVVADLHLTLNEEKTRMPTYGRTKDSTSLDSTTG